MSGFQANRPWRRLTSPCAGTLSRALQKACRHVMNSSELNNLREWKAWNQSVVWEAPLAPGIYVFRLAERKAIQRLKGESDVLYVGCSAKLRNRFKEHLKVMNVERNVAYRLQRVEQQIGRLEVSWESYDSADKAKDAERLLLAKYEMEHIEFPPLNRSESGKRSRMIEEWLKLRPGTMQDLLGVLAKIQSGEIKIPSST
jgi:hypothetical protein